MNGKPASQSDRDTFPNLRDDLGEDPARFLDRPLVDPSGVGSSPFELARARIRGIDKLAVINAWIAVEKQIDRGPRDRVLDLLQERMTELEANGGRPDLQTAGFDVRPDRYLPHDRDLPPADVEWIDADGEPYERNVVPVFASSISGGASA